MLPCRTNRDEGVTGAPKNSQNHRQTPQKERRSHNNAMFFGVVKYLASARVFTVFFGIVFQSRNNVVANQVGNAWNALVASLGLTTLLAIGTTHFFFIPC